MTQRRRRVHHRAELDYVSSAAMDAASSRGYIDDPAEADWLAEVYRVNQDRFRGRLVERELRGPCRGSGWPVAAFDPDESWRLRGEVMVLAGDERWRRPRVNDGPVRPGDN